MGDLFDLQRFLDAQAPVFERVCLELRAGRKRTHWMWLIFPQLAGLGSSPMAHRYAIGSRAEARAYWAHAVLGERLALCTRLVLGAEGRTAGEIFGYPDELKFRSSLTLFGLAAPEEAVFGAALERFFSAGADERTMARWGQLVS